MGLAAEIIRIATDEAATAGGTAVSALRLRVGEWAGVEVESLRFALEALGEDTPLAGCRVEIEKIPPLFRCAACGQTYTGDGYFAACGHCGALGGELMQGDELTVAELEVEEP
jgi:hydrogenase nickel incorporation protein HypA/HybF